ncbi:Mitochondrial distribution and morphology protein 37 [Cladobotryum mycophilum]|uniref:Mitochondrial distribution and morphology protein 37 n=1 Tax=Cladobotryum mycophilum TaxID=491253 RepID=A0ABR0SFR9_9HYPO
MSSFICSNSSKSLWRTVARDVIRQSSKIQTSTASRRWLSNCSLQRNPDPTKQGQWAATTRTGRALVAAAAAGGRQDGGRRMFFAPKIIKNYEELPRDYRDQVGLLFGMELPESEAMKIFGPDMSATRANYLLRILHGRRVAGTLEDPAFAVHTAQFDDQEIAIALAYLRRTVPVEEVRNAGLRAEDELEQLEQDMKQAAQKKEKAGKGEDAAVEYKVDPRYGPSKFDEMRARNLAKIRAKELALEEELKVKEADGKPGPLAKREDGTREILNPRVKEYYEKAQSDLEAPPEMKTWERILPSATVVALILGFMAAVAMVYEEPAPRYRLFWDVTTSQATVGALIAINALVFVGWRIPPLWALFNRYMIFVVATVRPITLFTAAFSHTKLSHLVVNMIPLWFVGTSLHDEIGRADFLLLYLGCGSLGFLGSLVTYTLRGWITVTSLGASGATLGLCSAYFWEHRTDGFKIFGLPQDGVHGIVFLAMITALQLAGLGKTVKLKVDIASHLAGIAAGILGIELLNRTERRKKQKQKEEGQEVGGEDDVVMDVLSGESTERQGKRK